jgi:hypothetical protein
MTVEEHNKEKNYGGEVRDTLFLRGAGERASYCQKVPRQWPLVLLIKIE